MHLTASSFLRERFARSDRMVGRRIADEYVLVPIVGHGAQLDGIFSLNRVATFIWERLDGQTSGEAIVEALVRDFDVAPPRADSDYQEFVKKLLGIHAITPQGQTAS